MAQCTAPKLGHIRGGGADCPVHGHLYRRRYGRYGAGSYSSPVYRPAVAAAPARVASYASRSSGGGGGGGGRSSTSRARRLSVSYTPVEYRTVNPVRENVVRLAQTGADLRDLFLCHAWPDREGDARALYNLLTGLDVKVWFSETDVPLGTSLIREIDKGLGRSRMGIVLVTPAFLESIQTDGSISDKELSALLATDRVIPIVHGVTFEELRDVSPLLAARSGLSTAESSLEDVAAKLADVAIIDAAAQP
jgi:TIR domain